MSNHITPELKQRIQRIWGFLDVNADGGVTRDEIRKSRKGGAMGSDFEDLFNEQDKDHDGRVTLQEWTEYYEAFLRGQERPTKIQLLQFSRRRSL